MKLPSTANNSKGQNIPSPDLIGQLQHQVEEKDKQISRLEFLLKKYKEQLETSHEQLESDKQRADVAEIYLDNIIRNINEHFYWMDKNGIMLGCNEQQAKSFGLENSDQLIGKNIYDVLYSLNWKPHIVEAIRENNTYVMRIGKTVVKEEVGFFYGEERIFISYKNPLLDKEKNVIGVFGFSIDITERKRAEKALLEAKEQLEKALRTKTEFLENMRHDLRTPFSGIVSLAESLEMKETDPAKKESLEWIVKSSTLFLNVLNDILAGADTVKSNGPKKYEVFSIKELISNLNGLLAAEIHCKNLELNVTIDPAIPLLAGDKQRLHRIILHLLTNAVKFTEKGSIEIHITPQDVQKEKLNLIMVIKDTGIGIPKDKIKSIFERFVKLKPSFLSNVYVGVGLGLTIVQKLIQDLNGTINVKSEEGKGTSFTCMIPFDIPDYTS